MLLFIALTCSSISSPVIGPRPFDQGHRLTSAHGGAKSFAVYAFALFFLFRFAVVACNDANR